MVAEPARQGGGVMEISPSTWDKMIASLPDAHILQTREWGEVKARIGWQPYYYIWIEDSGRLSLIQVTGGVNLPTGKPVSAALVLLRTVNLAGFSLRVLYIPKGPLLDWRNDFVRQGVIADLAKIARDLHAIFIKIDPDVVLGRGIPVGEASEECQQGQSIEKELHQMGWLPSAEQVQFRNTVLLDLTRSEDEILAAMKQKTRYNVRLAERKGVTIRTGTERDIPQLYQMYAETSVRDGFVIRDAAYYQYTWGKFIRSGLANPLLAEVDGEIIAGLILFVFANKAWYLFGMSRESHRDKMPNYLLQWAAIRQAKAAGCASYDLWGAPDTFDENDSMWGVYRFKEGLGGTVIRTIGAWDFPVKPGIYRWYTQVLPKLLSIMRWRGQNRTRQQIGL